MDIEYDQNKSERNVIERNLSFALAKEIEFDTALINLDLRKSYGEPRYNLLGLIHTRLYHMTFTLRGDAVRVISLRKANNREVKRYVLEN